MLPGSKTSNYCLIVLDLVFIAVLDLLKIIFAFPNYSIKMAVKLFFITGVPWIFEIVAWLPNYLPSISAQWRDNTKYLFEVSNLLNALRGVVVFIIFVLLRPDARRQLLIWLQQCFSRKSESSLGKASAGMGTRTAGSLSNTSTVTYQTQLSVSSDFGSSISSNSRSRSNSIQESSSESSVPTSPTSENTSL